MEIDIQEVSSFDDEDEEATVLFVPQDRAQGKVIRINA